MRGRRVMVSTRTVYGPQRAALKELYESIATITDERTSIGDGHRDELGAAGAAA